LKIILFSFITVLVIVIIFVIVVIIVRRRNSKRNKYIKIQSTSIPTVSESNITSINVGTGNTTINEKEVKIKVKRVFD
jgi:heme/copper-type cytochrome/quinol oxidase subunit 2